MCSVTILYLMLWLKTTIENYISLKKGISDRWSKLSPWWHPIRQLSIHSSDADTCHYYVPPLHRGTQEQECRFHSSNMSFQNLSRRRRSTKNKIYRLQKEGQVLEPKIATGPQSGSWQDMCHVCNSIFMQLLPWATLHWLGISGIPCYSRNRLPIHSHNHLDLINSGP